ncbi:hypothetical protein D3C80_1365970 [compost metagenome]
MFLAVEQIRHREHAIDRREAFQEPAGDFRHVEKATLNHFDKFTFATQLAVREPADGDRSVGLLFDEFTELGHGLFRRRRVACIGKTQVDISGLGPTHGHHGAGGQSQCKSKFLHFPTLFSS